MAARGRGYFALYGYSENLKKNSPLKVSGQFSNNFVEMFGWLFIRFLQAKLIGRKNMAARGRGYFALYGYSENFKKLLQRKCFQIIL